MFQNQFQAQSTINYDWTRKRERERVHKQEMDERKTKRNRKSLWFIRLITILMLLVFKCVAMHSHHIEIERETIQVYWQYILYDWYHIHIQLLLSMFGCARHASGNSFEILTHSESKNVNFKSTLNILNTLDKHIVEIIFNMTGSIEMLVFFCRKLTHTHERVHRHAHTSAHHWLSHFYSSMQMFISLNRHKTTTFCGV